jgi:hypothetical protein
MPASLNDERMARVRERGKGEEREQGSHGGGV